MYLRIRNIHTQSHIYYNIVILPCALGIIVLVLTCSGNGVYRRQGHNGLGRVLVHVWVEGIDVTRGLVFIIKVVR